MNWRPLILLFATLFYASTGGAAEPEEIALWSKGAPGSEGKSGSEKVVTSKSGERQVSSIHQPSITPFLPSKEKSNGVAVLVIPGDIGLAKIEAEAEAERIVASHAQTVPDPAELAAAARVLNAGSKVTILAGAGCQGAHDELVELAATLKSPIVHALRVARSLAPRCSHRHGRCRRTDRLAHEERSVLNSLKPIWTVSRRCRPSTFG